MKPENIKHRDRMIAVSITLGAGQEADFCTVKRPYLDLLLSRARTLFDYVGVWTAGTPDYGLKLTTAMFKDHYSPDFLLTKDHIVATGNDPGDYKKPLRVLDKIHPGMLDPRFTLFVDDTQKNFTDNMENGIVIPEFKPSLSDPFCNRDNHLLQLVNWLSSPEVANSQDWRQLDKTQIFTSKYGGIVANAPQQTPHRLLFSPF